MEWSRVTSLAAARRKRASELERWRCSLVSVFVGNICVAETDQSIVDEAWKHGRVLDSYFPLSRFNDRAPKYGFLRFKDLREALQVSEALDGLMWYGRKIKACIAKPRNPTSKPLSHPHRSHPTPQSSNRTQPTPPPSYFEVVKNNLSSENNKASLPPIVLLKEDLDREWLDCCAVAEVMNPSNITRLKNDIESGGSLQFSISFMGGSLVLLRFSSREDMLNCIDQRRYWLREFFGWIKPWSPEDACFDNFVWIIVENIPLFAWGINLFKRLGNSLGTFIAADTDTKNKSNLEKARILVLVNKDFVFPEEQRLIVDGKAFKLQISVDHHSDFLMENRYVSSVPQAEPWYVSSPSPENIFLDEDLGDDWLSFSRNSTGEERRPFTSIEKINSSTALPAMPAISPRAHAPTFDLLSVSPKKATVGEINSNSADLDFLEVVEANTFFNRSAFKVQNRVFDFCIEKLSMISSQTAPQDPNSTLCPSKPFTEPTVPFIPEPNNFTKSIDFISTPDQSLAIVPFNPPPPCQIAPPPSALISIPCPNSTLISSSHSPSPKSLPSPKLKSKPPSLNYKPLADPSNFSRKGKKKGK